MEVIIGVIGLLVSVGLYFAGVRHGRHQERDRRAHEMKLEHERQQHDKAIEAERRRHELISKMVDEYVDLVRRARAHGVYALSLLGLEQLASDADIRQAIRQMAIRAADGADPWSGQSKHVEDVDLVAFFRHVREHRINFANVSVEAVASSMRQQGREREPQ